MSRNLRFICGFICENLREIMKKIFTILLCLFLFSCQEKKERSYLPDEKEYAADSAIFLWEKEAKQDSLSGDINGVLYCYEGVYIALGEEKRRDFLFYKKKLLPLLTKAENASVAKTYKFLATAHHKNNEPDSARKYYHLALKIVEKFSIKNASEAAQCYAEYAVFLADMQDIANAKMYAKQAFLLNKKDSISQNELNLGRYFFLLGYEDSALSYIYKPLANNYLTTDRYRKLSEFYRNGQHENTDSAYFYTYQLIHALDTTKPKALGRAYKYLGEVLNKKQKYKAALDTLKMALLLRKEDKVGMVATYNTLSAVYFAQNQIDSALFSLQKGLSFATYQPFTGENPPVSTLLFPAESLELLMQKVVILQKKDPKRALQTADSTDIFIDKVRNSLQGEGSKLMLADKVADFYHRAMQLALAAGDKEKAFYFSEKSKGFLLFSAIKDLKYKYIANISQDTLDKEQALLQEMTWLKNKGKEEKSFEVSQQLTALQNRMAIQNPKYHDLKYKTKPVTLQALQQKLTAEQAIIEYVRGEMEGAWVITKDTSVFVALQTHIADSAILAFYALMADKNTNLSTYLSKAYPFYQALVLPIEKIAKQPNWVIIPDGTLNYLPFEALPNAGSVSPFPLYVLHQKSISYHYSASLWEHLEKTTFTGEQTNNYFVAAVDKFDNGMMILQGGKSLIETLKNTLGVGEDIFPAQKQPFMQHFQQEKKYPLVCLYTHSKADDYVAEKSVIHFKDDVLNLSEIFSLQIKAGLVVLASCESGKGKIHNGEGMSSLARGFMYAGGESVLPTKWTVSEKETRDILTLFVAELAKGTAKDHALQQAKIKYLAQNKDAIPYQWAAPFLVGNTEAIHFQANKKEGYNWGTIALSIVVLGLLVFYMFRRFSK